MIDERARSGRRWAVVLAGGVGRRLRSLTVDARGIHVPKQFCALRGERSLLQMALARAERLVPEDRIAVVVQRDHRSWWSHELADLPPAHVVVQPRDRGTAVGLALALRVVRRADPAAEVVLLPADHYLAREDLFAEGVELAFDEIEQRPERLVLLGVEAERPDVEVGWIVPGEAEEDRQALPVRRFREKPGRADARRLLAAGALVNCFVVVGRLGAFERLLETRPEIGQRLDPLGATPGADPARLAAVFDRLPRVDLSSDVFERWSGELAVLPLAAVGWSDLGTPQSVRRCLSRYRVPTLAARAGAHAPVDLSRPRPVSSSPVVVPADFARYTEML